MPQFPRNSRSSSSSSSSGGSAPIPIPANVYPQLQQQQQSTPTPRIPPQRPPVPPTRTIHSFEAPPATGGQLVDERALANATVMHGPDTMRVKLLQANMRNTSSSSSASSSHSSTYSNDAASAPPRNSAATRSILGNGYILGGDNNGAGEDDHSVVGVGGIAIASSSSTDDSQSEHGGRSGKRKRVASKRNACEACYNGRVKCEYESETSLRCKRCERLNKECVGRIVLRGGKPKNNKFISKINEYRANAGQQGPAGLALLAGSVFVPQHNLSHIELASAAQALVDLYRELGLGPGPPTGLRWLLNSLTMVAVRENDTTRMHHCTSVAMASGYKLRLNQLDPPRLHHDVYAHFDREIESELMDLSAGAAFVLKHEGNLRTVQANRHWEALFETTEQMARELLSRPQGLIWSRFVERRITEQFSAASLTAFLQAGEPKASVSGRPPRVAWSYMTPTKVELIDAEKCRFAANMYQTGVLSLEGHILYTIIGFRNLEPLDDNSRQRFQNVAQFRSPTHVDHTTRQGYPQLMHTQISEPAALHSHQQPPRQPLHLEQEAYLSQQRSMHPRMSEQQHQQYIFYQQQQHHHHQQQQQQQQHYAQQQRYLQQQQHQQQQAQLSHSQPLATTPGRSGDDFDELVSLFAVDTQQQYTHPSQQMPRPTMASGASRTPSSSAYMSTAPSTSPIAPSVASPSPRSKTKRRSPK